MACPTMENTPRISKTQTCLVLKCLIFFKGAPRLLCFWTKRYLVHKSNISNLSRKHFLFFFSRDFYTLYMSLTYFVPFPQMDGYEHLYLLTFIMCALLVSNYGWMVCQEPSYWKDCPPPPKRAFFFVSTKNYLEMIFSDEVNYVWHTPNSHKIKQHLRNF